MKRKEIMEGKKRYDWSKTKSKHGFWVKVKSEVRKEIDTWIRAHHHVIHSPITKDTVCARNPDDSTKWIPKSKLLLQCSLVELWNDLYSSQYGLGKIVCDDDGTKLVSVNMLKSLLPPEL